MHLSDKVAKHRFGHFVIGDNAVPQRADRYDITRGSTQHSLRIIADCQNEVCS